MHERECKAALTVTVPGEAAPQGSKRAFMRGGRIALVESSKRVRPFRDSVAIAAVAEGATIIDGPVELHVVFTFARPKSHFTSKGAIRSGAPDYPGKSDIDKLCRAVADALTGIAYRDDSQVVRLVAHKRYGHQASTSLQVFVA